MQLIDFWAEWCGPCKQMNPILEMMKKEFPDLEIIKVNIDENPGAAKEYDIKSIPTFIFKNGDNEVRVTGAMPKTPFYKALGLT